LRAARHAAVVSGAGPSVLVLTRRNPEDPSADPADALSVREVAALVPSGWTLLPLQVDLSGARVMHEGLEVSSA
jgi:homoserine kinase